MQVYNKLVLPMLIAALAAMTAIALRRSGGSRL